MASRKTNTSKRGVGPTKKSAVRRGARGPVAVSTDATIVLVDVPGIERVSQEFKEKVMQIAANLRVNPNFLMAIMSFETGGTFSPSVENAAGSGAVGLIQFMPATARGLGTTTKALKEMSAEEQLDFVASYFAPFKNRLTTIEDAYMAVLFPAAVGKGVGHILFTRGTRAYRQNGGLDIDQDGVITVGEAASKVRERLGAAPTGTGEILRRGVESPEVGKLQDELIDLGYMRPEQKASGPNRFGPLTEGALKRFQRDNQFDETGVYDEATQAAIRQLNEGVKRGSTGNVVVGLQLRLVGLGNLTLAQATSGRGTFGPLTEAALQTFQRQHGITPSGVLTDETYRALLASAPTPPPAVASADSTRIDTVLPAEGRGFTTYRREQGGADQFGRASTIRSLMGVAEAWAGRHAAPRLQFGDISRRGGGPFPPHRAHQRGLEVDLRPVTNNGREEASNFRAMNYSHELTKELVQLIRGQFPDVRIFFNDPRLIDSGLTAFLAGHDDHLHVRFAG
jgi:peptidoglycan hydrolase-like protein with peptidoglycan-binding domain